jgi:hypothetical protein
MRLRHIILVLRGRRQDRVFRCSDFGFMPGNGCFLPVNANGKAIL